MFQGFAGDQRLLHYGGVADYQWTLEHSFVWAGRCRWLFQYLVQGCLVTPHMPEAHSDICIYVIGPDSDEKIVRIHKKMFILVA
jgi:hypothetical protein